MGTTDQHVELRETRIKRNISDVKKLMDRLELFDVFQNTPDIKSFGSGVIGDKSINCYEARGNEEKLIDKLVGKQYKDVIICRADKVNPVAKMNTTTRIRDKEIEIDPMLLF